VQPQQNLPKYCVYFTHAGKKFLEIIFVILSYHVLTKSNLPFCSYWALLKKAYISLLKKRTSRENILGQGSNMIGYIG